MGVDLGYTLLIALAAMKITELYKEYMKRIGIHQIAWWKSVFNIGCCFALTLLVYLGSHYTRSVVLIALAAAGLSSLLHALDTVLRSHRDDMVNRTFNKIPERRRR
jgi:hypothetical protein